MNNYEIYQMNAAAQVSQLAFQEYQQYTGFQSVNGLNSTAQDAINGQAPVWTRVDFGFHTTSSFLSNERTISENGNYLMEMQSDPLMMILGAVRPGDNPTGQLDDVPVGDMMIPMLLMVVGYTLWRKILHHARISNARKDL